MAIPTILNANPRTGPPYGGYLVAIRGTNFRLPDLIPNSDVVQESVRILFGTFQVPTNWVKVRSSSLIEVRAPQDISDPALVTYPLMVSLTVTNIDALGVPIPLETVTLLLGFQYTKVDLNGLIIEEIWRWLRRFIARNLPISTDSVVGVVNVDYQSDTLLTLPKGTSLPAIIILGPKLRTAPIGTESLQNEGASGLLVARLPKAYDFIYDIQLVENHKKQQDAFQMRLEQVIRNASLMDITWLGKSYQLCLRWEETISFTNTSDLEGSVLSSLGSIVVENVPAEGDIISLDRTIDTISMTLI
jgi:hypothetical protein